MRITRDNIGVNSLIQDIQKISKNDMFECNINKSKDIKPADNGSMASLIQEAVSNDLISDKIARKVARGEKLTPEEKEKIKKIDPEKLRKAEMANKRREELEKEIRYCRNDKEAKAIIMEAKMGARQIVASDDQQYGEMLIEAINKAEDSNYKGKLSNSNHQNKAQYKNKKGKYIDAKF